MKRLLGIVLALIPIMVFGQTGALRGKVTDAGSSDPLVGARGCGAPRHSYS